MGTALIPCVPVPQPPFCFLWWRCIGLRSGSWGHRLASELRTRAAAQPSGWVAHPHPCPPPPRILTMPFAPYELSGGLDGASSCILSPHPNPPFPLPCRGWIRCTLEKDRVATSQAQLSPTSILSITQGGRVDLLGIGPAT